MVTIVFFILMLMIFGKLLIFGIKAAWGISKFLLTVVLLPVILIGLVIGGLFSIALAGYRGCIPVHIQNFIKSGMTAET